MSTFILQLHLAGGLNSMSIVGVEPKQEFFDRAEAKECRNAFSSEGATDAGVFCMDSIREVCLQSSIFSILLKSHLKLYFQDCR